MRSPEHHPRIVRLGETVPAFEFPLKPWTDYGRDPNNEGLYSDLTFRSTVLPELNFFVVVESFEPTEWSIRVEADKIQMAQLGLISRSVFLNRRIGGLDGYKFYPEAWDALAPLGVILTTEGVAHQGVANPLTMEDGELIFDTFRKVSEPKSRLSLMTTTLGNTDFLRGAQLQFSFNPLYERNN